MPIWHPATTLLPVRRTQVPPPLNPVPWERAINSLPVGVVAQFFSHLVQGEGGRDPGLERKKREYP